MDHPNKIRNLVNKVVNNPLLRQSILSLFARFAGVALNFLVIMIITNALNKTAAGDIMLLMTFITGIALVSRLGVDQLLMKEVASAHEADSSYHTSFLHNCYKVVLGLSFIFMLLWLLASPLVQRYFFYSDAQATVSLPALIYASLGILAFNFVILNSTFLKALKHTVMGVLGQNALTATTFLVLILAFWRTFTETQTVLYLYTSSLILAGIIAMLFTYRHTRKRLQHTTTAATGNLSAPDLKSLLSQSIPFAPISIISYFMIFTDTIMVGWFLPNEQVAEYGVASRVSYIILFFLQAMEATIYPRLLNMFQYDRAKLIPFFWQATLLVVSVIFTVTFAMYLTSGWILNAFGTEYDVAKPALAILLAAQLLRAASITFSFMFIIREKVQYLNRILGVAFVVNIICNVILIGMYGIIGAAIATFIANAVLVLLVITLFYTKGLLILPMPADAKQTTEGL